MDLKEDFLLNVGYPCSNGKKKWDTFETGYHLFRLRHSKNPLERDFERQLPPINRFLLIQNEIQTIIGLLTLLIAIFTFLALF